jgi:primary-amine oxidase
MGEYLPALTGIPPREVKPLPSASPRASRSPSTVNLLSWQNWQLRLGFNYREGLVLHTVGFTDGGRLRSVAHRLSFAEMVVPYRDPPPTTTAVPRSISASGAWAS